MAGKVIRLLPDRIVFTKKIESWLHDMAREGLILKKMSTHFAVFEEKEPEELYYRIVAFEEDYFVNDVKDMYEQEGWYIIIDQVSWFPFGNMLDEIKFKVFMSENDVEPPEKLYAFHDETFLKEIHKKSAKKHKSYMAVGLMLLVGSIIVLFFLPAMSTFGVLSMYGLVLLIAATLEKRYRSQIAYKETEENKEYSIYDRAEYWKGCIAKYRKLLILSTVCAFLIFTFALGPGLIGMYLLNHRDMIHVPNYVSLADIQQSEEGLYGDVFGDYMLTPFVPIYYYVHQRAIIENPGYDDIQPVYSIEYSKSIVPYITFIAYGSAKRSDLKDEDYELKYSESEHFDKVEYTEYQENDIYYSYVYMVNKSELILLYYRGNKTAEEIIAAVEKTLYE